MGRRATDLATPVPVLGVPALVGLRGYKTAGPPPLPSLSWTQQCSIGVQTSPGVGKLPLLHPCARPPVNIVFTPSGNYGTRALESFGVAKELKEEGVPQPPQSDRLQGLASKQRCVEAKTRKEVTFQEAPAGTSEHREGSQANDKSDCCYARAIKTNPHLAGSLPRGGPKPKLNLRYTNGSVVDSAAVGGISVEGAEARPVKDGAPALCRDQVHPGGGHCGEQAAEGASAAAAGQPFRTPPKICNQCGGKQALLPYGPDIMGWQKPTGACPEGRPLNPGTIPSPSTATAANTTTATDMGKLRDLQVGHSQQAPGRTPCLAGRLPPLSPNTPHPSCPVHSAPAIPQCHSVAPLPPQTPTSIPAALHTKALTVTEAVIETRQHDDSSEIKPHANKPSLPACLSSPPQFAIATKSNIPYGCSYRKRTETSNCITARSNVADDGAVHVAPSNTKPPAAVPESTRSNTPPTPPGPEDTPNTIKSTSTNALRTDFKIHMYTVGLKGPNTVNDSITVKNKNMKNKESPDSSRSTKPMNSAKLSKASLEMVMNTKNNAKTAMRPQTFPGSILHLSTTQVMDTLSSYKQNNTAFPGGTHVHIETPTHTTTIAKTSTDLVAATNPFKRVGTPLEANPSDTKTAPAPKPTSSHSSADLIRCLSLKPPPITPESQIIATSDSEAVSPSAPSTIIPLHEEGSSSAANPAAASPELIENPRSGHQSRDVSPHTSSDGAPHLTDILNLNRPSHTNRSLPTTQTLPDPQTHSRNGPALEKAVVIHHSSPTLASQGLRGPAVQLSEPLTLSDRMHLAGELPNSSHARETKAQHLHRFPAHLLKNMATLTVSDQCMSNHTYTVNTIQRDTQVNSLIQSCFDPNKDDYKCIDIPEKRNSKPHQNSIFLKVTHHLNYISRLKPQGQVKQQLLQLQGCTDPVDKVRTAPQTPVRPSQETPRPGAAVPCLPAPPAPDDLEAGTGDSDERSLCSTSPVRTPTNLRRSPAPAAADATADSSFEESTGGSSRRRTSASDTPSSPLTWPHSSPGSVPSQSALDAAGERELCPHSPPTTPSCGVRLQRPWTNLSALAHLRSRVRACPGTGRTLVPRGPEAAHAHPPDAELRLLPPSPRCSKTAALQWRLETVEASLEANRSRISSLLHIIQDLEHSQVSIAGCWCFRTGQDLQNCSICQRTACVVYSVEYDFRQQERCLAALLGPLAGGGPPAHAAAAASPAHQTHNVTSLRDAFARRVARSKVKSKKLCKTFFKLLPRKSQQR